MGSVVAKVRKRTSILFFYADLVASMHVHLLSHMLFFFHKVIQIKLKNYKRISFSIIHQMSRLFVWNPSIICNYSLLLLLKKTCI
jgi:hypothetical protein